MNTIEIIKKHKIIAIVRGVNKDKIIDLANALYKGGIRLIEVTFNQSSNTCITDTAESIKMLNEEFKDRICLGAGTVMTCQQVKAAIKAGAKYIISPNTDKEVIKITKELGAVSIPGAFTPSETVIAYKYGADFVKLFPAGILGIKYIKAVLSPISHIPMMAVGGISDINLHEFLDTGICGVGVGSSLVNLKLINEGRFDEITQIAKRFSLGDNANE